MKHEENITLKLFWDVESGAVAAFIIGAALSATLITAPLSALTVLP
jgi:hypothetical protein